MKPFWFCLTDKGCVREENEDHYFEPSSVRDADLMDSGHLFAVADGMGGCDNGSLASQITVRALDEYYHLRMEKGLDEKEWLKQADSNIKALVARINNYIFGFRYLSEDEPTDMGTTLAGAAIKGSSALVFHVGDSRVYHLSAKTGFRQVTRDHSKTQSLVEQGLITPEGARNHPDHHVVTRSLGTDQARGKVDAETCFLKLEPADQLLICSDGLTDMVPDDTIASVMMFNGSDLEGNAQKLVDEAIANGGYDNITLILIQIRPDGIDTGKGGDTDSSSEPCETDSEIIETEEDTDNEKQ